MSDKHQIEAIGPVEVDTQADPGGDPLVPAPGTRLSGIALGIDVGGTGVKAALVDLGTAALVGPRIRERTPQPSTPEAVSATIASVVTKVLLGHDTPGVLPVGCGLAGHRQERTAGERREHRSGLGRLAGDGQHRGGHRSTRAHRQ